MTHLVPLKVYIGLRSNGYADHPDFNKLPGNVRGNMDWAHYIDQSGGDGWFYDKRCGHRETDINDQDVPLDHEHRNIEVGCQFGCLLVPEAFADAAVAMFGNSKHKIKIINEASFESFYNDRAHHHEEDELVDLDALNKINARITAGDDSEATAKKKKDALNPDHPARGVKKNYRKRWADWKKHRGIEIRAKERMA